MTYSFEDKLSEIEAAIEKKRSKWVLEAVPSVDFDDIKQIMLAHIHKKWPKWDQSRPVGPWLSTVVGNKFKNELRNHYGNYARPCMRCPHNGGGNLCGITVNGLQNESCEEYRHWKKKKKSAYDIKLAVTMENHLHEINNQPDSFVNIGQIIEKLSDLMEEELTPKQFLAFKMLFIEKHSEADVAAFLGYKTKEKKRVAGYRQIKNLKKILYSTAKKVIEENDIVL
jgi:DNA-directed RNA polymerase specialized sigma24 family protein